jgi:hypothetical protein
MFSQINRQNGGGYFFIQPNFLKFVAILFYVRKMYGIFFHLKGPKHEILGSWVFILTKPTTKGKQKKLFLFKFRLICAILYC